MRRTIKGLIIGLIMFSCSYGQTKLYWTDFVDGTISRSNLDGSNVEVLISSGEPAGITFDLNSNLMYWADIANGTINRSDLNGFNVDTLVSGLSGPAFLKLDLNNNKIYWTNFQDNTIKRSNLDGSNVETLITNSDGPTGIALDLVNEKVYWTNAGTPPTLQRANTDGTNIETLLTLSDDPVDLAIDMNNNKIYWSALYDRIFTANLDGSNIDSTIFTGAFVIAGFALDLVNNKIYWGDSSENNVGSNLLMSANLDGTNVDTLLTNLQRPIGIALTTPTVGINDNTDNLSKAFKLYPNYPNPFNPTTSINYYLPSASSVELRIYNQLGQEILTLVNAIQSIGTHQVEWDGRDSKRNLMPSGLYFLRMKAGSFVETRKMILLR